MSRPDSSLLLEGSQRLVRSVYQKTPSAILSFRQFTGSPDFSIFACASAAYILFGKAALSALSKIFGVTKTADKKNGQPAVSCSGFFDPALILSSRLYYNRTLLADFGFGETIGNPLSVEKSTANGQRKPWLEYLMFERHLTACSPVGHPALLIF